MPGEERDRVDAEGKKPVRMQGDHFSSGARLATCLCCVGPGDVPVMSDEERGGRRHRAHDTLTPREGKWSGRVGNIIPLVCSDVTVLLIFVGSFVGMTEDTNSTQRQ